MLELRQSYIKKCLFIPILFLFYYLKGLYMASHNNNKNNNNNNNNNNNIYLPIAQT